MAKFLMQRADMLRRRKNQKRGSDYTPKENATQAQ
jgi:hypothetical protein